MEEVGDAKQAKVEEEKEAEVKGKGSLKQINKKECPFIHL